MLSEKFLNEFEEYLKSGRLEEDYACSAEDRKVEILEYLERFMDLAEEADRAASWSLSCVMRSRTRSTG